MRIQHNIMAMNAYRNYNNNTSKLSKNLEKLSSGYKINRAGDDAAGLAISEKMRAQITGLKQAQDNAKSGINLVQTAEGALQEVHDMLNRMVKLADQSANGIYTDNGVDREALQEEVSALKTEIDRISKASNFNGKTLLDGSLAEAAKLPEISGDGLTINSSDAVANKVTFSLATGSVNGVKDGQKLRLNIGYYDSEGTFQTAGLAAEYSKDKKALIDDDGNVLLNLGNGGATQDVTAAQLGEAFSKLLDKEMGNEFNVSHDGAGSITVESKTPGSTVRFDDAFTDFKAGANGAESGRVDIDTGWTSVAGKNASTGVSGFTEDKIFEINGKKFAFTSAAGALGDDVNEIVTGGQAFTQQNYQDMADLIKKETGVSVKVGADNASLEFTPSGKDGGLNLQIGDTADDFNKITVTIDDMSTKGLSIDGIDISTEEKAAEAVKKINDAIDTVSTQRGKLGATQNRLEHTINNLSVMTENIQDAESNIRDTDVADEMMAYTKNNILIQSAQAMLAQANQVPQGVLQLLQ